jgi:thioredoxin reductase (NADPH)
MERIFDIAIIGGGPAGLTAGIWLARYLHSVVLIDSGDPRNWDTRSINGFLGLPHICPPELHALGREECRRIGVELIDDIVTAARKTNDDFALELAEGASLRARRVLLAIGIRDIWPEIPGLAHTFGQNAHVCPDCDGYEARGKKVVVIGSGRRAVGMALNLTTWTRDIIICTNGEPPGLDVTEYCEKLDALNIPVLTEPILRVVCEGGGRAIHSLELRDGMHLDADKIFLAVGQFPADDAGTKLSLQLGCERDDEGHILIDSHYHTSVHDVFAAGDIVPGPQLAIAAASDGAIAALSIHKSLVPEGRKLTPLDQLAATSGA